MTRIFISAGEASGDEHGSALIRALQERLPGVLIAGIGGPKMAAAGATILQAIDDMAVVGLVEGVRSLPAHLHLLRRVQRHLQLQHYDLVVLIDYPGFNMRVAAAARRVGVPVLYYIAPQLWAWGRWRVKSLRANVASLAVILPFEVEFFRGHGIAAEFVGNPLIDRPAAANRCDLRDELGLGDHTAVLTLLPGSRPHEIERLWPAFRDAARLVQRAESDVRVIVAAVRGARYPEGEGFVFVEDRSNDLLAASDVAICKSGTTTLEAALQETPMVVAYRMHPLSYVVARRAVRVSNVALVNLLARRTVAPEILQKYVTAENLFAAAHPLLDRSGAAATEQRRALREIRHSLGSPGVSARVADMACGLVA